MGRINKENYEAYFLDFLEGNLTDEQQDQLNQFLEKNPSLKNELAEMELHFLPEEGGKSSSIKASLIREESTALLEKDYLMISQIEGTINEEEKAALGNMIRQNEALADDLAIYHKTKLLPEDGMISFPLKKELIQKERKLILWWHYASAAAAAVLLLLVFNGKHIDPAYQPYEMAWNVTETTEDVTPSGIVVKEEAPAIEYNQEIQEELPLMESSQLANLRKEESPKEGSTDIVEKESIEEVLAENQFAENNTIQQETPSDSEPKVDEEVPSEPVLAELPKKGEEEYTPLGEYAKNKIKNDLLKGKTFSETIVEEIKEIAEKKLDYETKENEEGEKVGFAFNLGKISISKNK